MTKQNEIQTEIDAKRRVLERQGGACVMYLFLAISHAIAIFFPFTAAYFAGLGLSLAVLCHIGSVAVARDIAKLTKQRKSIDEQVDAFVEERSDAIKRRMQAMMEAEAREQARRRNLPAMFKGNCIDVTPEKH